MKRKCNECGEPIAEKRLRAIPDAERCVTCQAIDDINAPRNVVLNPVVQNALAVGGVFDVDMMAELASAVNG